MIEDTSSDPSDKHASPCTGVSSIYVGSSTPVAGHDGYMVIGVVSDKGGVVVVGSGVVVGVYISMGVLFL